MNHLRPDLVLFWAARVVRDHLLTVAPERLVRTVTPAGTTKQVILGKVVLLYAEAHVVTLRDYVPESLIQKVLASGPCIYCLGPSETHDHRLAVSRGGNGLETNLAPACHACNVEKLNGFWAPGCRATSRVSGLRQSFFD